MNARKRQQAVDQDAQPGGRRLHSLHVVASLLAEQLAEFRLQAIAEGLNLAQRLLQIVRGHRGKLLQLAVAAIQRLVRLRKIGGALAHPLFQQGMRPAQHLGSPPLGLQFAHRQHRRSTDDGQRNCRGGQDGHDARRLTAAGPSRAGLHQLPFDLLHLCDDFARPVHLLLANAAHDQGPRCLQALLAAHGDSLGQVRQDRVRLGSQQVHVPLLLGIIDHGARSASIRWGMRWTASS